MHAQEIFRRIYSSKWTLGGLASLGLAIFSCFILPTAAQQSTGAPGSQGRKLTLSEQLQAGLKAVTKADHAFIDEVVSRVQQGKLPRRLVDSTFLWARERADRKSRSRSLRPMVYFRPALTLRARRIGVHL